MNTDCPPRLVTPAVPPLFRVAKAPDPYGEAAGAALATLEPERPPAPLEPTPDEELRPPPAAMVGEETCTGLAPLVDPEAVAALLDPEADDDGAGAGEGAGEGAGVGAVVGEGPAVEEGGGAGGVDGTP